MINQIVNHCKQLVQDYDFGMRDCNNGTQEQQLTGLIGQSVVMDIFGVGMIAGGGGFDGGIDLIYNGRKIDVKTMGRTTDVRSYYVNNFMKCQEDYQTDIYIFCSLNKLKLELTVCGWITKSEFQRRCKYFPAGSVRTRLDGSQFKTFADMYEICNIELNDVNGELDLLTQLSRI